MEKKSQNQEFLNKLSSVAEEYANTGSGYLLIAYNETENGQENGLASKGKITNLAECLFNCMMRDEILTNVVMSASNAIAQMRMAQMQALMEQAPAEPDKKPKRNRKKITN